MTRSIAPIRFTATVILAMGLAACAAAGTSPPTSIEPSAPPPTAAVSPSMPNPTMTPDPPAPSLGEPPAANLAADGGDPVAGSLGSFTWGDGGSDSPWLPGAPITVGAGEPLIVMVAAGAPVKEWTARRVSAGTADGVGAVVLGRGAGVPIGFTAPPRGDWSVQLTVTFDDDLGSATYYWAVTVT